MKKRSDIEENWQEIFFSDNKKDIQKLSSLAKVKLKVEESKVYVRQKSPNSFGLFTKKRISKGEKIIDFAGEILSEERLQVIFEKNPKIAKEISAYLVEASGVLIRCDRYIKTETNFARFANHNASGPNAVIAKNKKGILPYYQALHTIPANWEIVIDYGKKYHLDFIVERINPAPDNYSLNLPYSYRSTPLELTKEEQLVFCLNPIENESRVNVRLPLFFEKKKNKKKKISYEDAHLPILQIKQRNPIILDNTANISSLMWACFQGRLEKIEQLIKSGVDVNALSHDGKNALLFLILGKGKPERCVSFIEKFENRKVIFNHIFHGNMNILNLAIIEAESKKEKMIYVDNLAKNYYKKIASENKGEDKGNINIVLFCINYKYFSSLDSILKNIPSNVVETSLSDEALRRMILKDCFENPTEPYASTIKRSFEKYNYTEDNHWGLSQGSPLQLLSLMGNESKSSKRKLSDQAKRSLRSLKKTMLTPSIS